MKRRFFTLDVFTERRFAGNPLAVVLEPVGLETDTMQAIAHEFNYPETVFVFQPADKKNRAAIRIFNPAAEMPFAGHPTVGTAVLLALLDGGSEGEFVLEEKIGNVPCRYLGILTLLVGATGAFGQLQEALNAIWEVKPKKRGGIGRLLRSRLLSFGTILGTGFLLLVSLAVSTAIGALVDTANNFEWMAPYIAALDIAASLIVITCLFALIFKLLPDVAIEWRDVWVGAVLTAALFVVGKFAIGFYLGISDVGSAYGAAGSIIVILVWIYYSALILFFGAEFTQVWASNRKSRAGGKPVAPASVHGEEARDRAKEIPWVVVAAAVVVAWMGGRKPKAAGAVPTHVRTRR